MELFDTHLHLIHRGRLGYAWTRHVPDLAEGDFTLARYVGSGPGAPGGALFMEADVDAGQYRDEARMAAGLARDPATPIRGVVASCRPEEEAGFEAWLDEAEALGVVGFRRVLHVVGDEVSQTKTFRRNLRRLGSRGKTFDVCVLARQLPLAADLAAACPDTHLILDHCGQPDIAEGAFGTWREAISALSRAPNVVCKLSGLTSYCAPHDRSLSAVRPYVDHVLDIFGPQRMLWGSDWPVVNTGAGLADWLAMTRAILGDLSQSEAAAIARKTAERIYGLSAGV